MIRTKFSSIKHYRVADHVAIIGTNKGLVVYDFSNGEATLRTVHFAGFATNMVFVDQRNGRWWAGLNHKHWGQKLHFSDDQGGSWQEAALPNFKGYQLPNGQQPKLRQIWCMAEAGPDKPNELWLGTDPGGLFYSQDNGNSFELAESLWNHPSRQQEGQWFGAGSDYPFIHSIVVDPSDFNHVYIAVSCAGVFETTDGGVSWEPKNKGLKAAYLPNPHVEVGHDPHTLFMSPVNTAIMWQQNHCGIYHSLNGGDEWIDSSDPSDLPSYGFSMVNDEHDPAKAWVIPVQSDEQRIAPGMKLQVFRTEDYGKTWEPDNDGLPTEPCFDIVLRQAFARKDNLFLFGTTNGNLYFRMNSEWVLINSHLTKVNAVFVV